MDRVRGMIVNNDTSIGVSTADPYRVTRLECPDCGKLCGFAGRDFQGEVFLFCKRCRKQVMFHRDGFGVTYASI